MARKLAVIEQRTAALPEIEARLAELLILLQQARPDHPEQTRCP